MTDSKVYPVDPAFAENAWADEATYEAMYRQSIEDPEAFWSEQAKRLDWIQFPTKIKNTSFAFLAMSIFVGMKMVCSTSQQTVLTVT